MHAAYVGAGAAVFGVGVAGVHIVVEVEEGVVVVAAVAVVVAVGVEVEEHNPAAFEVVEADPWVVAIVAAHKEGSHHLCHRTPMAH